MAFIFEMKDLSWEQLRPPSELFVVKSLSPDSQFTSLAWTIIGNTQCTTTDGVFQLFDPDTDFISYCTTLMAGLIISATFALPIIYRIYDLSRHEKGQITVKGQIAKIGATLTPFLYLSWFFVNGMHLAWIEWLIIGTNFVAAALNHIQDGRVTVCCGELLGYWLGMLAVYLSLAMNAILSSELSSSWLLIASAAFSAMTFFLECFNSSRDPSGGEVPAFDNANIFSKISLSFANDLIAKGSKENLSKVDYPREPNGLNAVNGYTHLEAELDKIPENARFRVMRAICCMLNTQLAVLIILDVLAEAVSYVQPSVLGLFLDSLIKYSAGKSQLFTSYYFAVLMGVTPMITTSLTNLVRLICNRSLITIRVSLISVIYRKALKLAPGARENFEASKVMNLISVDSGQVVNVATFLPTLISAPVGLIVSIWQLWLFLGPSMFAAIALYTVLIPLSGAFSASIGNMFPAQMAAKDKRNKLTSNAFRNIKSLKLYSWEKPFYERIVDVRVNSELAIQRKVSLIVSALGLIWNMMGDLIAAAVFITFLYLKQGGLTPEVVFPSIMLLQYATTPFMALPMSISSLLRCLTSQNRLNELFTQNEQDYANYVRSSERSHGFEETSLTVEDATISWNGEDSTQKIALENITFKASHGDLVCVTGRVGAGKTAMLKALGGELSILSGSVSIKGSIAYCSQEPWLQNQTLRNNILFGQEFQEYWYNKVIDACELISDIKQMPKGDSTDVGERGISLSGGQKARVALARAVYSRADVFLLDDVLSAVDEHVSAKLIKKLFGSRGLLANRTIVLATNNVKVLSHSSLIIALENKKVVAADPFAEIIRKRQDSKIYRLIEEFGHADDLKQEAEHIENRKAVVLEIEKNDPDFHPTGLHVKPVKITAANVRLISDDDEEQENEAASLWIFKRYFAQLKPWYSIFFIVSLVLSTIITNCTNIYLGYMSNQALETLTDAKWYITAYLAIVVISSLGIFISNVWCNIVIGLRTSKILHNKMLWNLMHAPMTFFDATPLGRLINRFTTDVASLDDRLSTVLYYTTRSFLNLVVNLITIISGGPIVSLVIIPLAYFGNEYRKLYVPASRKVSRMGSAADSPILSHIEESLKGQSLLRTFDRTAQFIDIYEQRVDYWIRISFTQYNLSQWLGFRIQMMSAILMLASATSVVHLVGKDYISVGYGAVVLHFATRAGIMVRQTLDFLAQIEVSGVSLSRILEYVDIKQEAAYHVEDTEPHKLWPDKGKVEFKELSARYTEDGQDVLKNLSLIINGGEKVGIVGRTGSGKSSLTMALFRILEAHSGHIEIDGTDTSGLGLFDLRSRLAIIPQDAQIFDGTVRENLDPLNTEDDVRLWEVLELCHLKDYFQSQDLGLDTLLSDSGDNLSRGQSQLVCLGRALIHHAKVLVLDEATASVDVETDKIVQETIRKNFNDRTIITIAHRLNTIMDSDRIIVLDSGEIKEFDTPENLMNSKGLFYSLHNAEKKERESE